MSRRDVESTEPFASNAPQPLPARHPLNILKRALYMGISLWGLHKFEVYHTILHSPDVQHEWFKIGLAASVAILAIKSYVEIYAGKIQRKTVNYETFRSTTHAIIFLILLSSLAFHVALWPVYGWKTMLILAAFGFGVLIQFALVAPTYVQNIVGTLLMTFFIQEYV